MDGFGELLPELSCLGLLSTMVLNVCCGKKGRPITWVKCTTPAGCIESKCLAVSTVLNIELLNSRGYDMFLTHPNLIISLKFDGRT